MWRSLKRASIPSKKELLGLTREDGKRPDGVTLIPWSCGRCLTWDVTVSDTFATSHLAITSCGAGEAAKRKKYATVTQTHDFVAGALESSSAWSTEGLDFVLELGRRLTDTTLDKLEANYLFQRLGCHSAREHHLLCLDLTMLNCNCIKIIIIIIIVIIIIIIIIIIMIYNASGDTRKTRFLFQSLSVTVQHYNSVAFQGTLSGLPVAECHP